MNEEEKRKHQRIHSLNLSYVCLDENRKAVKQGMGRTLNLSESGILLETRFPIAAEHTVALSIGLQDELVDVTGRPVYVRSREQGLYEIGIEFLDPDEKVRTTIRRFLQDRPQQGT
jgi:hypothetical protein